MNFVNDRHWGPWGLYNRFEDDWLVTRQAVKLFLVSAVYLLALTPVFLGRIDIAHMSLWMRLVWDILGAVGAVAVFFLWIGMLRYWIRIDRSKKWIRRLSFVVLLLGFWYGACLYCFAVYTPQVLRKERPEI